MSSIPPPKDLGDTRHDGLAAAMAVDRADSNPDNSGRVIAQLLYGYLLLDSMGQENGFVVVEGPDGKPELPIFTSNEEVAAFGRPGEPSQRVMVMPAPEVLKLVVASNIDSIIINPGGAPMRFMRPTIEFTLQSPLHIRLREALALPLEKERHAAVLNVLAYPTPDEQLVIALYPESIPADGNLTHAVPKTSTNAEGNKVMLVFTSVTEAMLATEGRYAWEPVANILRIAEHPSIGGILINQVTDFDVVLRAELQAMSASSSAAPEN